MSDVQEHSEVARKSVVLIKKVLDWGNKADTISLHDQLDSLEVSSLLSIRTLLADGIKEAFRQEGLG